MKSLPPIRPGIDHDIKIVPGAEPVQQAAYRASATNNDELKRQTDELLSLGFIRVSQSPYASPVIFVKKKDGTIRMCIDYRALNKITVPNKYPLPLADELFERLIDAKYFTKLDLRSGYHQIRMTESSIQKTAFTTRYGQFEFLVMPFGLTNAPSTFMSAMHKTLNQFIDKCVIVFLDDILIYSNTQDDHTRDVNAIFQVLQDNDLYVKLSKCEFGITETEFLGHVVGNGCIKMSPQKVKVINEWPNLSNVADALSRKSDLRPTELDIQSQPSGSELNVQFDESVPNDVQVNTIDIYTISTFTVGEDFLQRIQSSYKDDAKCQAILQSNGTNEFTVNNNMIYKGHRLYIPPLHALTSTLLHEYHDTLNACHRGVDKTHHLLLQHYYWPNMYNDVEQYVKSCIPCEQSKISNHAPYGQLTQRDIPKRLFEEITMDFITSLPQTIHGHNGVLVIVDRLSKWTKIIPTKSTSVEIKTPTAEITADLVLEYWVRDREVPSLIISDRDVQFTSAFWKQLWSKQGCKLAMSSSYHPQTDGQTERSNRTIEEILRCYCNEQQNNWDQYISSVEQALNHSLHSSLNETPYSVVYQQPKRLPADVTVLQLTDALPSVKSQLEPRDSIRQRATANLQKAQQRQKLYADKHRQHIEFQIGQHVFVNTERLRLPSDNTETSNKLKPRYAGPFKIIDKINNVAYRLQLPATAKIHDVFHISRFRKYNPRVNELVNDQGETIPSIPDIIDGEDEYEVEKIISHKDIPKSNNTKIRKYLVKWVGYNHSFNTYEPFDALHNARDIVTQYDKRIALEATDKALNDITNLVHVHKRFKQNKSVRQSTRNKPSLKLNTIRRSNINVIQCMFIDYHQYRVINNVIQL